MPSTVFVAVTRGYAGEKWTTFVLSPAHRRKAQSTIDDLRLNEWHHLRKRLVWLRLVSAAILDETAEMTAESEEQRAHVASRTTPYSSITLWWLSERGHRPG